jgi:hypothetical protein
LRDDLKEATGPLSTIAATTTGFTLPLVQGLFGAGIAGLLHTIDLAITVVVLIVADLFGGFAFSDTGGPLAIDAGLGAGPTEPFALGTRGTGVAALREAIDVAITVVVFPVTDLFFGQDLSFAFSPLAIAVAGLGAGLADPNAFGLWRTGVALLFGAWNAVTTFVDCAITVVVDLIFAAFCLREHLSGTGTPATGLAGLKPLLANPFARCAGGACIAGIGGNLIIDLAVAVVILAVATLCLREHLPGTGTQFSFGGAGLGTATALTYTCCSLGAPITEFGLSWAAGAAVIDLAIAVVILLVAADLSDGQDLPLAGAPFSFGARLDACLTKADAQRCRGAGVTGTGLDVVVDLAIAVVILGVTGLHPWGHLTLTNSPFTVFITGLHPGAADSNVQGLGDS